MSEPLGGTHLSEPPPPLGSGLLGAPPPAPVTSRSLLASQAARESNARAYPRRLPVALVTGRGVVVRDADGREYLDCLAGAGALALGHHHPVVNEAIRRCLADEVPLTTLDLTTPVKEAFVEQLFAVVPPSLRHGRVHFCGPTGADAVEAAVKLVRTATGRSTIVAFSGSYHGTTQGTTALTGSRARAQGASPVTGTHFLPFPSGRRCPLGSPAVVHPDDDADESGRRCAHLLRHTLVDGQSGVPAPAGVIFEPIQGEGGVNPTPKGFAHALRALTTEVGATLIADEVQTGVGRAGSMWGVDALGIQPDVLVLSKAIGGGLPLSVIVYRAELDVWDAGAHAGTFRGNQLAMAAGGATLRFVAEAGLVEHAAARGEQLIDGLRAAAANDDAVGDVRGRGLMVGVEIVDPSSLDPDGRPRPDGAQAAAIQSALLEAGVIAELGGPDASVVRFLPPLIITAAQVDAVVERFALALDRARATRPDA